MTVGFAKVSLMGEESKVRVITRQSHHHVIPSKARNLKSPNHISPGPSCWLQGSMTAPPVLSALVDSRLRGNDGHPLLPLWVADQVRNDVTTRYMECTPYGYCLKASMTGTVCSGLVCADGVVCYPVKVDVFA